MTDWSYSGQTGPEYWSGLRTGWEIAASGLRQSPVDLEGADSGPFPEIEVNYGRPLVLLHDEGHGIHASPLHRESILIGGLRYDLTDIHVHLPAEHAIGGERSAAEVHLVHKSTDGALVALGVFVDVGEAHPQLEEIFGRPDPGPTQSAATLDAAALLPGDDSLWFTYEGSLTTPPCTEGVRWYVAVDRITATRSQLGAIFDVQGPSARPVQRPHGRKIVVSS